MFHIKVITAILNSNPYHFILTDSIYVLFTRTFTSKKFKFCKVLLFILIKFSPKLNGQNLERYFY